MRLRSAPGFLLFALALPALPVLAQHRENVPEEVLTESVATPRRPAIPNEFGISDQSIFIVPSSGFVPIDSGTTHTYVGSGFRSITTGSFMDAPVQLPSGSLMNAIELEACDTSPTTELRLDLFDCGNSPTSVCNIAASVATGVAATPGCFYFSADVTPNIQTNNYTGSYFLSLEDPDHLVTTRFRGVRIYYRRQVSPAPGVASFPNDVPTSHPYFRFIEALARAGVTGGCAPGAYCPNNPITRGEMAVFLAAALGLHFPL